MRHDLQNLSRDLLGVRQQKAVRGLGEITQRRRKARVVRHGREMLQQGVGHPPAQEAVAADVQRRFRGRQIAHLHAIRTAWGKRDRPWRFERRRRRQPVRRDADPGGQMIDLAGLDRSSRQLRGSGLRRAQPQRLAWPCGERFAFRMQAFEALPDQIMPAFVFRRALVLPAAD